MSAMLSDCDPPRNVANSSREPAGSSSAIMASTTPPLYVVSGAPAVTGKSAEPVLPASHAFPAGSTTTAFTDSPEDPPTNVEESSPDPLAFTLVTNASPLTYVASKAP